MDYPKSCCCVGPQNGQPLCPCQMKSTKVINGRLVKVTDLGPAYKKSNPSPMTGFFDWDYGAKIDV